MNKSLIILSLLFLTSACTTFNEKKFKTGMVQANGIYTGFSAGEEIKNLAIQGKSSELIQFMKSLVPENEKSFFDYFILGNMLFSLDREASYQYMRQAEEKHPNNPYVLFERGLHEHRLRNYEAAAKYYQSVQSSRIGQKNKHIISAYLTHIYLMTGKLKEAFKSWDAAEFGRHHTHIEKAMYTVFDNSKQEYEREHLISSINAGETHKLCDLYKLDSNWEIDWWNYQARKDYLTFDFQLAKNILIKGSLDEQYFDLCRSNKKLSNAQYINNLKKLGILDGKKQLPESSALIYKILRTLTLSRIMSPQEFLDQFENQIVQYAKQHPTDIKYYDVLAFLYVKTSHAEKLKAVDLYGWKTLMLERYASSYVVGIDSKLKQFKQILNEALNDFPLSPTLNELQFLSLQPENKKYAIAKFVGSQFSNLKNLSTSTKRLSDYMTGLKNKINELEH